MILLPASEYSIEELTDAYNLTRTDYLIPMPMNPGRLQEYITLYDVDLACSYVAVSENVIVGLGMLGIRPDMGWITRLGVLPDGRRRGVGNAILQHLLDEAAKRELPAVWLEVIQGNTPAHELFKKHHFRETRELIVARRPPSVTRNMSAVMRARKVHYLQHNEAIELLCRRQEQSNWLNSVQSMSNVRLLATVDEPNSNMPYERPHLSGIWVEFHDFSQGWVTYQATTLQLKHINLEVIRGDPTQTAAHLLEFMHRLHASQDAVVENIPDDARWPGFQQAGYFEVFRRIEMVRQTTEPI